MRQPSIAIVLLLLTCGSSTAAPRIVTFDWNYKNRPVVAPYAGYEYVVVSTRGILAPGVADSLKAFGAGALVWMQPGIAVTNGVPVSGRDYPWDSAALDLVKRRGALLRKGNGQLVELFPRVTHGAQVLDFRDSVFVDEYAALIASTFRGKAVGILQDYGCGDIAWAELGVERSVWPAWRRGFIRLCDRLRALGFLVIIQCDKYPKDLVPVSDGAFYEQAGMSLNPLTKVWSNTVVQPERRMFVRLENLVPQKRRAFATLSLLAGACFNWSDLRGDYGGGTKETYRDFEHFDMNVGPATGPIVTLAPGVYSRPFERGAAVLNASGRTYVYKLTSTVQFRIPPEDGLVIQTRDEAARTIRRITNEGK
jgi:hypothetical protein